MKICVVCADYKQQFPLLSYGGIEIAFESMCKGLHKYFSETVKFCAIVPKILKNKDTTLGFKIIETQFIESSISGQPAIHFAAEAGDIIKTSTDKPDIIWSSGDWSVKALHHLNIPIICTIMDSGGWEEGKFLLKENVYYRFSSKFIYDLVFKDSENNEYIKKVKQQSFWCHTGSYDDEFDFEYEKEDYILWVAGLNWGISSKGLDLFIELARRRSDKTFVAYGTGNGYIEEQLKQLSRDVKNFNFMGPLMRGEQHRRVFKKAKLFTFLTQIPEAFGRTGLEAITKGTPVLGSTKGAVPELYAPAGLCTDSVDEMVNFLDVEINYKDVYEYSQKFHVKHELETLIQKCTEILEK